ncbi:alcohol dehydrogenase catalytic domain-containing protein [Oricola cellulosilytica]|uniref:Galactitol-1-phosphate 5-dehydrogenase n=1 Tax=Oricola cellulosilytica TaxID=1429082 RepID=A0A4R0PA89_9HYPH|nr:alcohol dehydrogenase catalytic domain-containing protein [Oricola cellulosilytica]TCD13162.1 galactitol-1-phosphate 5-dehydrogenase [Oricola cellulosilytica]
MKALVYTGPEQLEYRDEPEASPGDGEVMVQVDAVGICGSDMHAYLGHDDRRPAPLILGHEAAGVVVSGPDTGRRVTINPLVTCGQCQACRSRRNNLCPDRQIISMPPRPGAFAQFVSMPAQNLVTVPDGYSLETASMAEPLACGWHAVRMAESASVIPLAEAKCQVIGGGAIGLGAALALVAMGATDVAIGETNTLRHPALENAGPVKIYNPRSEAAVGDGEADIVIDGVGFAATREAACRLVRGGGVIVHIGLGESTGGLDIRRVTLQEVTFIGTYTYTPDDFRETTDAMFDGLLGKLDWAETRALADGVGAFADIRSGRAAAPKIILKP